MVESSFKTMRNMTPGIKQLFQTRHYIPCAAVCEGLLAQLDGQLHPIHKAFLNFYIALSHDALAREARMRNRGEELELAEKHYMTAIADLDPTAQPSPAAEAYSSTSSESDESMDLSRRPSNASSVESCHSASSAATSVSEEQEEQERKRPEFTHSPKKSVSFAAPPSHQSEQVDSSSMECTPIRSSLSPLNPGMASCSAPSKHETRLSAHVVSFTEIIKGHLAGVRTLKGTTPTYYRSSSYPRTSPFGSRRASRDFSVSQLDMEMERIRLQRKNITFRPRFDPTSVRKLCAEALEGL